MRILPRSAARGARCRWGLRSRALRKDEAGSAKLAAALLLRRKTQTESLRGFECWTPSRTSETLECIHVMDREGDIFDLMAAAASVRRASSFAATKSSVGRRAGYLQTSQNLQPRAYSKAEVRPGLQPSAITPSEGRKYEKARTAKLSIGSDTVELRRPKNRYRGQIPQSQRRLCVGKIAATRRRPIDCCGYDGTIETNKQRLRSSKLPILVGDRDFSKSQNGLAFENGSLNRITL